MTQAQVRTATGVIEAVGYFPAGSPDPGVRIVDLTDEQLAAMAELGTKTLNEDGAITVTPPDPLPPPAPTQAEQVDQLVADGKAALAVAPIQTDEGRALAAIFAGALDGLGKIYGTLPGDQP